MEERDTFPFGAEAGCVVDETNAGRSATCQRAVEIVDGEADVMNTGSTFGDELANWGIGGVGLEELHERLAGLHSCNTGAVGVIERHFGHSENVAIEWKDLVERLYRDAYVGDAGRAIGNVGHVARALEGLPRR